MDRGGPISAIVDAVVDGVTGRSTRNHGFRIYLCTVRFFAITGTISIITDMPFRRFRRAASQRVRGRAGDAKS